MQNSSNTAYILLGGNLLDVKHTFELAILEITRKIGRVSQQSPLYKSEAWGFESDHDFLNQVIELKTNLSAQNLLVSVLEIEQHLGRIRHPESVGFSSRIIDIDILYYNDEVLKSNHLVVPHYAMHERLFTLLPLNDIIPNYIHPVLKKTNAELLDLCTDKNIPVKI